MALYHYFHRVDDAVDEAPDAASAKEALQFWRGETERLYRAKENALSSLSFTEIGQKLLPAIQEFQLPEVEFERFLTTLEGELAGEYVLPTQAKLEEYCRGVAAAPGLLVLRVLGADTPALQRFGERLAYALQLTNILRDAAADYRQGRIYLPRHCFAGDDVSFLASEAMPAAWQALYRQAESAWQEVMEIPEKRWTREESRKMRVPLLMRDGYYYLLFRRLRGYGEPLPNAPRWRRILFLTQRLLRYGLRDFPAFTVWRSAG